MALDSKRSKKTQLSGALTGNGSSIKKMYDCSGRLHLEQVSSLLIIHRLHEHGWFARDKHILSGRRAYSY